MKRDLGDIVYLRTYARYNDDEGRRETWEETIDRVVNWSTSLAPVTSDEKRSLRSLWIDKKAAPAGRSLWVGGTEYSRNFGLGNFNCSFTTIRSSQDFHDILFLLMSGAGVGFSARAADVYALDKELPLRKLARVHIDQYNYVGNPGIIEHSFVQDIGFNSVRLVVGDSRKGWAEAVQLFLEKLISVDDIYINVNYIRPHGSKLRTFGGTASGPEPLIEFFQKTPEILKREPYGRWSSTKILDIANLIGRSIVAGGTRRSAQIALGDAGDTEFEEAKTGSWYTKYPWRSQSNNSIIYTERPDISALVDNLHRALQYGEPGFVNGEQASRRKQGWEGLNPCAEILLRSKGLCNLTTINLMAFVRNGAVDLQSLLEAVRLQVRHNLRVTLLQLELEEWDNVQKQDRLLGLSFTGFGDLIDALNIDMATAAALLQEMRREAKGEARRYASELGVNPPELVTTIKPEGTISQVMGVSSGIHPNFGPYYIRRIRINDHDAVAQALIELGYPYETDVINPNILVFSFPVKTPAKKSIYEYSAIELLERYKMSMRYYTDHNTSITIYLDESEIDDVAAWLHNNWDNYVAVSFLRKDNNVYPQQPYELIDEQRYNELMASMPSWDRSVLDAIERNAMHATDIIDAECAGGACPIR